MWPVEKGGEGEENSSLQLDGGQTSLSSPSSSVSSLYSLPHSLPHPLTLSSPPSSLLPGRPATLPPL